MTSVIKYTLRSFLEIEALRLGPQRFVGKVYLFHFGAVRPISSSIDKCMERNQCSAERMWRMKKQSATDGRSTTFKIDPYVALCFAGFAGVAIIRIKIWNNFHLISKYDRFYFILYLLCNTRQYFSYIAT